MGRQGGWSRPEQRRIRVQELEHRCRQDRSEQGSQPKARRDVLRLPDRDRLRERRDRREG